LGFDAGLFKNVVIGHNGLGRRDLILHDSTTHFNKSQRVFGEVNFSSVKRDAGSVFAHVVDELERVHRCACTAAENAHDEVGIVRNEFFQRAWAVAGNLKENRAPFFGR